MSKKTDVKERVIAEMINELRLCSVEQLIIMCQLIQIAGRASMDLSNATNKLGRGIGINMEILGPSPGLKS